MQRRVLKYGILKNEVGQTPTERISRRGRDGCWQMETVAQYFMFNLKLDSPSRVELIEVKGYNTRVMELTLRGVDSEIISSKVYTFKRPDEGKIIQCKDKRLVAVVEVKLVNSLKDSLPMGINHLIFQGMPSQQQIQAQKPIEIMRACEDVCEGVREDVCESVKAPQKHKQDLTLLEQIYDFHLQGKTGRLATVYLSEYEHSRLQNVNFRWVEAQRAFEKKFGVREEHQLSRRVQIKHLRRKRMCLAGLNEERRVMLRQLGQKMGGEFVEEPVENCLIVTTRVEGKKIKNLKKYRGLQMVSEEFIINTERFNRLVNECDYLIH